MLGFMVRPIASKMEGLFGCGVDPTCFCSYLRHAGLLVRRTRGHCCGPRCPHSWLCDQDYEFHPTLGVSLACIFVIVIHIYLVIAPSLSEGLTCRVSMQGTTSRRWKPTILQSRSPQFYIPMITIM